MAVPQLIVEVDFTATAAGAVFTVGDPTLGQVGVTPVGSSDVWTDITAYVRSWSVKRGAGQGDAPTLRYDAGTASVELNDADRRFDPENLSGPYVSAGVTQVEPMRRVRIRAAWNGTTYPIFQGYADDWVPAYQGNSWTYTTLSATDASVVLNSVNRTATSLVGAGETSGARVTRILDSIGWSTAARVIATGDTTVQSTDLAGLPLTELQLVQDTEQGELFIDAQSRVVFRNRQASLEETRSNTSQATFGDAGYFRSLAYDFESGIDGWGPGSGGSVVAGLSAHTGGGGLQLTVSGSPVQAYVRTTVDVPVVPGHRYQVSMWVRRSTSGSVLAAIDWKDASHGYLGGSYPSTSVTGGVWTQIQVTDTAPSNAPFIAFGPTLDGSPVNGTTLDLDDVTVVDLDNELPYADAVQSTPGDTLVNTVFAARAGGTEQTVSNAASVSRYTAKTHTRDDLIMQDDATALQWASALLYQYGTPARRFARIDFNTPAPQVQNTFWPALLGREFGDRITVMRRPAGGGTIDRDCFVRGVEHHSDGVAWTSAFVLQGADRFSFFRVGDPILGRAGLNAVGY